MISDFASPLMAVNGCTLNVQRSYNNNDEYCCAYARIRKYMQFIYPAELTAGAIECYNWTALIRRQCFCEQINDKHLCRIVYDYYCIRIECLAIQESCESLATSICFFAHLHQVALYDPLSHGIPTISQMSRWQEIIDFRVEIVKWNKNIYSIVIFHYSCMQQQFCKEWKFIQSGMTCCKQYAWKYVNIWKKMDRSVVFPAIIHAHVEWACGYDVRHTHTHMTIILGLTSE